MSDGHDAFEPHLKQCVFEISGLDIDNLPSDLAEEIRVTLYDLNEENLFDCPNYPSANGHRVVVSLEREVGQIFFAVQDGDGNNLHAHGCTLSRFIRETRDYTQILGSYYSAIRTSMNADKIQTIDMARRGIHNDGAETLRTRLSDKGLYIDEDTARRLYMVMFSMTRTSKDMEILSGSGMAFPSYDSMPPSRDVSVAPLPRA